MIHILILLAILTARPIEELVNLGNLDRTGDIIEKVLYGTIEEKVDALVLLNEVITTNLHESKESLIKNAEFISRTFADVLDGIFYRCQDDIPIKFVKYLVQVFKKWFCVDFIIKAVSEQELTILVEVILLKIQPSTMNLINDFNIRQEISKDLNGIMLHIIDSSELSTWFYTLLDLNKVRPLSWAKPDVTNSSEMIT